MTALGDGDLASAVPPLSAALWVAYGLLFLQRAIRPPVVRRDRRAIPGIALQLSTAVMLWWLPVRRTDAGPVIAATAFSAAVLGLCLSWLALRALRPYWGLHADIRTGHRLVVSGPYGWIRHPLHLGYLLLLSGTGIVHVGAGWTAALVGVSLAGIWIRTKVEDRLLQSEFGKSFDEYAARVPALIPWKRWTGHRRN